ncbi:hypothetical protein JCM19300_1207 [Algibacter lectus]|uniref:Uncharacterized protein n=1 Tax=Algibacter lectus TaxID=221126 RepID=A0A090VEG6_9FLAO|nr:hypothetical protein JCM19300_1207 [Algibacter lectus]
MALYCCCASFKKTRKQNKLSWINKIFGTNKVEKIPTRKIDYIQISNDWNADPVSPEIELKVDGIHLIMDIYLNHFRFDKYQAGDKVKIRFKNCSEYSLNTCNDEGYFYGQYRTNHNELPWGEFYEIKSGLDKELPNPIEKIQTSNSDRKHFIFFFKDETFECLASDYYLDFYNEKVLDSCKTNYNVVLGDKEIGTSKLEKADASMGVAFGLIEFNGIETPYEFFKEYCLKNNIVINTDDPEYEFIDTQVISELKVFRQDGLEIKGVAGNAITGMKDEGYEISILGISYPFYEEEFPHHVEHYRNMYKSK